MGSFSRWIKKNNLSEESNPVDKFKFNNEDDYARDYEKDFQELVKVLMAKYNTQFSNFITQLGDERNDHEIKDLLRKTQIGRKHGYEDLTKPVHPKEVEDVSMPTADRGTMGQP